MPSAYLIADVDVTDPVRYVIPGAANIARSFTRGIAGSALALVEPIAFSKMDGFDVMPRSPSATMAAMSPFWSMSRRM